MKNFLNTTITTFQGQVVEVMLSGNAANVMLLDGANYQHYRNGRPFRYYGGHFTRSPVRIAPPHPGLWHVVVDLGGAQGRVNASVRLVGAGA